MDSVNEAWAEFAEADRLSGLASDYDRWGLGPEAEVARLQARRIVVQALIAKAQAGSRRSLEHRVSRDVEG